jgi:capsular polysaccharide transport system permease protein
MILGMYILGAVVGYKPGGMPMLLFAVTGILTWHAFVLLVVPVKMGNMIRLLMFPQITPLDLMLASLVTYTVNNAAMYVLFAFLGGLFHQIPWPADPFGVFLAVACAALLGLGFGLLVTIVGRFTTIVHDGIRTIHYTGHLLSGVYLLATTTPPLMLNCLRWNPMLQVIEWVRQSWWAPYRSPVLNIPYIFGFIVLLFFFGLAFERSTRKWEVE